MDMMNRKVDGNVEQFMESRIFEKEHAKILLEWNILSFNLSKLKVVLYICMSFSSSLLPIFQLLT